MEYKQPGLPRKVLHKLRETCYTAFGNAFTKPDPKLIVFSSEPDFSDNSRVLFEYMQDNGFAESYRFIWLVNEPEQFAALHLSLIHI